MSPLTSCTRSALDRYRPASLATCAVYAPDASVDNRRIVRHDPPLNRRRWIFTGTFLTHATYPAVTVPDTRRCRRSCREMIRGCSGPVTVNTFELVAEPLGVVTEILPVLAPVGTVVVIFVSELITNVADVPANLTKVAPVKPAPLIVTVVPTRPLVGENEVIVGAAASAGPATTIVAATVAAATAPLRTATVAGRDNPPPSSSRGPLPGRIMPYRTLPVPERITLPSCGCAAKVRVS